MLPPLFLWIFGQIVRHLLFFMPAGKSTHKHTCRCNAYHPCSTLSHWENSRNKVSPFFFFLFLSLALLPICVSEKYIIHASALTWRFHLHQQRVHTRKTYVAEFGKLEWLIHPSGCVTGRADRENEQLCKMAREEPDLVILKDSANASSLCKLRGFDNVGT